MEGAALFSQKTGAAIIPIFLIREKDNTYHLSICDPIIPHENVGGLEDKELTARIMKQYVSVMEDKIREHPTQWLMFRKFWVDNPPLNK
jgi:Kdo2-lipid IVA lauroyltransferase/acyltransferase